MSAFLAPTSPDITQREIQNQARVRAIAGDCMVLLENEGPAVVEAGLRYVHNDTCYPALLCIGQFIDALQSGKYDVHKTALIITQTGGGCRASNYIFLLRKALKKAGLGFVPVISLNPAGLEENSGFKITLTLLLQAIMMILYADVLMCLKNQAEPYENEPGTCARLVTAWAERLTEQFHGNPRAAALKFKANLARIAREFDAVPYTPAQKVQVGIVGEIYVKYSQLANNHLERFLLELPQDISAYYHNLLFNRSTSRLFNEEMLYTIEMFFKKDLNLSDTARQLYIHRNTLTYRLDKIEKIIGLDLRHFEDAVTFKMLLEMKKRIQNPDAERSKHE